MLSLFVLIYKTRLLVAADHDLPFVLLFSVRKRMTCLQSVEKCAESLRAIPKNGTGEGRFEASYKRQPVTESSYINSLAPPPAGQLSKPYLQPCLDHCPRAKGQAPRSVVHGP